MAIKSSNERPHSLRFSFPNRRSVFRVVASVALLALSTGVQGSATSPNAISHSRKARSVIYIGEVNARSAMRFLDLVAGYENRHVSLDVLVKPDAPGEFEKLRYYTNCDDDHSVIGMIGRNGIGIEVVHDGACKSLAGRFAIRGSSS
jgi:hypothetical protein